MKRFPIVICSSISLCFMLLAGENAWSAPTGKLSGKVKSAGVGTSAFLPGDVRAFNLFTPTYTYGSALTASNSYSFNVPVGTYVVKTVVYSATQYREKISVQTVTAKKKPNKARLLGQTTSPTGPTVSVGNIVWQNSSATPYKNFDGKTWLWDNTFATDLAAVPSTCNLTYVEDRDFGHYQDILKELKLRSSKLVAASERINYSKAVKTLNAWAPQFRLTGNVTSSDNTMSAGATASLQLVDLKKGKSIWHKNYALTDGTDILTVSEKAARDVERILCQDGLPLTISGNFTTTFTTLGDTPYHGNADRYQGTITYTLDHPDFWINRPYPLGVGEFAQYFPTSVSYTATTGGGSPCSLTGQASDSFTVPPGGLGGMLQLEIRTDDDSIQRHYSITLEGAQQIATQVTNQCGLINDEATKVWQPAIESPDTTENPFQVSDAEITGHFNVTTTQYSQDYTWNLEMDNGQ